MISATPNMPIATTTKPMPSESSGMSKVKRSTPELTSVPIRPSSRPKITIAIALVSEPREHRGRNQSEDHQREVFRRPELERHLGERRRGDGDHQRRDAAGEERAHGGGGERRPGAPLASHLVPVETGDDRSRLARKVDQDRGGGAAVLRAVIDAGKHDQRGDRAQVERDRQQHRDRGHRADAGQHADERAEHDADQRVEQVQGRDRDAEAEDQVVEDIHRGS